MFKIGDEDAVNILRFFDDSPDPRSEVNRLHRLGDVIVIAICAVIATADGPTAIAKWAQLNERWLRKHLAWPNGIPGKDTFRRVLGLLNPTAFQQCFQQGLQSLSPSVDGGPEDKTHIAIDGKTMRRSHDRRNGLGPMHIVSAWASDRGITLSLKGNQGKLFDDVKWLLDGHLRDDFADCPVSCYVEAEEGHGRVEERRYYQITAPAYLRGRSQWKGLKTIGAAVRLYRENGVEKMDTRYFISSLRRNGKQFANAVRNHWAIENTLHWSLDMTYREDESRVRNRRFAENLSWLRRMTLSLIKQHPGKQSNIMKRRMAGWSVDFLMQILTGKGT